MYRFLTFLPLPFPPFHFCFFSLSFPPFLSTSFSLFSFVQELSDDESSVGSSVNPLDESGLVSAAPSEEMVLESRVTSANTIEVSYTLTWRQYAATIKTTAVVSLSLCKLIGDLLLSSGEVFQISHLDQLLTSLESMYWHALLYHGNDKLLSRLQQRGFMIISPGPNLLEQEVQSARVLLRTIIDIYLSTGGSCEELEVFIAPWFSRYLRCSVYVAFFAFRVFFLLCLFCLFRFPYLIFIRVIITRFSIFIYFYFSYIYIWYIYSMLFFFF